MRNGYLDTWLWISEFFIKKFKCGKRVELLWNKKFNLIHSSQQTFSIKNNSFVCKTRTAEIINCRRVVIRCHRLRCETIATLHLTATIKQEKLQRLRGDNKTVPPLKLFHTQCLVDSYCKYEIRIVVYNVIITAGAHYQE